jgi:hypothetical protein
MKLKTLELRSAAGNGNQRSRKMVRPVNRSEQLILGDFVPAFQKGIAGHDSHDD